jgi:hypothetical protein
MTCISGIMIVWKGMIIVATNTRNMILLNLLFVLTSIQAVIDASTIRIAMETRVTIRELPKERRKFIFSMAFRKYSNVNFGGSASISL